MSLKSILILPLMIVIWATQTGAGCATTYTTPGGPADLSAVGAPMSGPSDSQRERGIRGDGISEAFEAQPLARFPAGVAVARVQESGYRSYASDSYGGGRYSVVTVREQEIESQEKLEAIKALPEWRESPQSIVCC